MDLRILPDGSIDLSSGDIVQTSTAEDIGQKLYRALLSMPANIIAGQNSLTYTELQVTVKAYLMQYFAGDKFVNPAMIDVVMSTDHGGEHTSVQLTYRDPVAVDSEKEVRTGLDYAVADGSVATITTEPISFADFDQPSYVTITQPFIVTEPTAMVILPVCPALDLDAGTVCIYARTEEADDPITRSTVAFTIKTAPRRKTYTIVNYLDAIPDAPYSIYDVVVDTATVPYAIDKSFGQCSISASQEGMIHGSVRVLNCEHVTTVYECYDTHVESPAFPLSPLRGKYRAIFPKPLSVGRYVIQYTGIIPG